MTIMATPTPPIVPPLASSTMFVERRVTPRISWSAIIAGVAIAGGTWLLVQLFGFGAGLSMVERVSMNRVGFATIALTFLAPILALFVGGVVAGRGALTFRPSDAIVHGAVTWGITVIGALLMVGSIGATALFGLDADADPRAVQAAAAAGRLVLAWAFTMLVALGAAIGGAMLTMRRRRHDVVEPSRVATAP
jgi:hypothetical protein